MKVSWPCFLLKSKIFLKLFTPIEKIVLFSFSFVILNGSKLNDMIFCDIKFDYCLENTLTVGCKASFKYFNGKICGNYSQVDPACVIKFALKPFHRVEMFSSLKFAQVSITKGENNPSVKNFSFFFSFA